MVIANSQVLLVHGLFINSVDNNAVFVQIVHQTDDDTLLLFYITDFTTFKVNIIPLKDIKHPIWKMIFKRFGSNNQILVMKINTFFTSYEFNYFLHLVLNGEIQSMSSERDGSE